MSSTPGPDTTSSPLNSPSPLVGRSRELTFLRDALAAAMRGQGRLVLLGGEAGIGKTALARSLARDAETAGALILSGYCYDLAHTPPYGPWLDLFREHLDAPGLPPIPTAFREGPSSRITDQSVLFADVSRFIAGLAAIHPIYILLEDLHWADPASIELLRYVAVALERVPVLLVATYRSDELGRDSALFNHLPSLVREGNGARLHPRRLDTDALHALVTPYDLIPDDVTRLASYLERHADGNPLFALELLRALEEKELLRTENDRWVLGEIDHIIVPTLLSQVIEGRIARLGEEIREPLAIASVIGQEVPLALWAEMAKLDDESLLTIVERLVHAHVMHAQRDGIRVRFVHALTREAIYEGILPPRRRLWHLQVGERLAVEDDVDPETVALHFQQAGDPRAWKWLVRAADRAQHVYAWITAAERLRAAAALLKGVKGQERVYSEVVFRIAYLLRFSDPSASLDALVEVAMLANQAGERAMAAEIQHVRGIHLCYAGQFDAGVTQMLHSLDVLESLPPDTARTSAAIRSWFSAAASSTTPVDLAEDESVVERLYSAGLDFRRCTYVWHLASTGQSRKSIPISEHLVTLLSDMTGAREGLRISIAFAYHAMGIAFAALGRVDDAKRAWKQSREVFSIVDHYALIAFTQLHEMQDVALTYGASDPTARRRLAFEAETSLAQAGGALRPGVSARLAWLGCLTLDGRWDEAGEILCDLPDPGNAYLQRPVRTTAAVLARYRGEPERAWDQIHALMPDGPATHAGNMIHQEGLFFQRLAAELCMDAGDLRSARLWLEAHDRWLDWSGSVLGQADGCVSWARWHQLTGELTRARSRAADAIEFASAPDQPLARLAASRILGELDSAVGDQVGAEAHLSTALDLARVCEVPFERALILLALADLRISSGDVDAAIPLIQEARDLCARLGALPALGRADDLLARMETMLSSKAHPAGLTTRELEVLALLVEHRTDKEIAQALFISPHTASTHVKHLLAKLGAASRRDAAIIAADQHLL